MTDFIYMKTSLSENQKGIHKVPLFKRMIVGGSIAMLLIIVFLYGVDHPKPEWGKLWKLRPILVVSFAGAMGGLIFHIMDYYRSKGGWWKIIANIASLIAYIIGLWLGTVLGLDGTLWD